MGTRARLGYAAFDVQLQKTYFVTTLYAICTSVQAYVIVYTLKLIVRYGSVANRANNDNHGNHISVCNDVQATNR